MKLNEVVVDPYVQMTASDGVVLVSTVYRPAGPGKYPVLLTRLPYGRDRAGLPGYFDPLAVAQRGFVVVVQDVRGRGDSGGEFVPSVHEDKDGAETVQWAAGLEYSDGRVGMWGRSYFSETQLRAAKTPSEHLRGLALGVAAGGHANDGAMFRGGAVEIGSRFGWAHYSIAAADPGARAQTDPAWEDLDRLITEGGWPTRTPLSDPENAMVDLDLSLISAELEEGPGGRGARAWDSAYRQPLDLPTLHIGGWYDIFLLNSLGMYQQQRNGPRGEDTRLIIGPWVHVNQTGVYPEISFGAPGSGLSVAGLGSLQDLHLRWYDAVFSEEMTRLWEHNVLLFVMGTNRWLAADELPTPDEREAWHLGADQSLGLEQPVAGATEFVSDPEDPVPTVGGATMLPAHHLPGPRVQNAVEDRDDVAVFTSAPLQDDLTIFGEACATLTVEVDAPDADLVVRLCIVDEEGRSVGIADGISRLGQRDNLDEWGHYVGDGQRRDLAAGERVRVPVMLSPTCWTVKRGQRLRVNVAGSSFPRWDANPQNGQRMYVGDAAPRRATVRLLHDADSPSDLEIGTLDLSRVTLV